MATIKGKGVVFGITATGFSFAGVAANDLEPTGQTIRHEAEITRYKDKDGDDVGAAVYNRTKRMTLNVYPTASTIADAKTANNLPVIGVACAITDPDDGEAASNWMLESAEKTKSNTEITTWTLELSNGLDVDYSADAS